MWTFLPTIPIFVGSFIELTTTSNCQHTVCDGQVQVFGGDTGNLGGNQVVVVKIVKIDWADARVRTQALGTSD